MTVVEHLTELRRRLIIAASPSRSAAIVCFVFSDSIIRFFLQYYRDATDGERQKLIFTGAARRVRHPTEGRDLRRDRARVAVVALAAVAVHHAGLEPEGEAVRDPVRRSVDRAVRGRAVVALLTLPQALGFLLNVGGDELSRCSPPTSTSSLVSLMILAFGLAFEFPVVLVFLLLAQVITTQQLSRWRRWAIVADRRVRGRDHAEPGPVLSVRHGDTHVLFYELRS